MSAFAGNSASPWNEPASAPSSARSVSPEPQHQTNHPNMQGSNFSNSNSVFPTGNARSKKPHSGGESVVSFNQQLVTASQQSVMDQNAKQAGFNIDSLNNNNATRTQFSSLTAPAASLSPAPFGDTTVDSTDNNNANQNNNASSTTPCNNSNNASSSIVAVSTSRGPSLGTFINDPKNSQNASSLPVANIKNFIAEQGGLQKLQGKELRCIISKDGSGGNIRGTLGKKILTRKAGDEDYECLAWNAVIDPNNDPAAAKILPQIDCESKVAMTFPNHQFSYYYLEIIPTAVIPALIGNLSPEDILNEHQNGDNNNNTPSTASLASTVESKVDGVHQHINQLANTVDSALNQSLKNTVDNALSQNHQSIKKIEEQTASSFEEIKTNFVSVTSTISDNVRHQHDQTLALQASSAEIQGQLLGITDMVKQQQQSQKQAQQQQHELHNQLMEQNRELQQQLLNQQQQLNSVRTHQNAPAASSSTAPDGLLQQLISLQRQQQQQQQQQQKMMMDFQNNANRALAAMAATVAANSSTSNDSSNVPPKSVSSTNAPSSFSSYGNNFVGAFDLRQATRKTSRRDNDDDPSSSSSSSSSDDYDSDEDDPLKGAVVSASTIPNFGFNLDPDYIHKWPKQIYNIDNSSFQHIWNNLVNRTQGTLDLNFGVKKHDSENKLITTSRQTVFNTLAFCARDYGRFDETAKATQVAILKQNYTTWFVSSAMANAAGSGSYIDGKKLDLELRQVNESKIQRAITKHTVVSSSGGKGKNKNKKNSKKKNKTSNNPSSRPQITNSPSSTSRSNSAAGNARAATGRH